MDNEEAAAQDALKQLERVAKLGRTAWEALFKLIDDSDEQGEIVMFFEEYVENEGTYSSGVEEKEEGESSDDIPQSV